MRVVSSLVTASLKSRLVRRLVPLQAVLLAVFALLVVVTLWSTGLFMHQRDEQRVIHVLREAVARDAAGDLVIRETPELKKLRSGTPELWFQIRDRGRPLPDGRHRAAGICGPRQRA